MLVNVRLFVQFIRFRRLRPSALLTWPGRGRRCTRLFLGVGAVLAIAHRLQARVPADADPINVFGETMMLVYYVYAMPLSHKIGRGFDQDGIWADAGFVPDLKYRRPVLAGRAKSRRCLTDLPDAGVRAQPRRS